MSAVVKFQLKVPTVPEFCKKPSVNVDFVDVQERYPLSENIICYFRLKEYEVKDGDRIAIFKLGWNSLKNYVLFEWVVKPLETHKKHYVIFCHEDLPMEANVIDELYQFCYISSDNTLQGVSTPFQIANTTTTYTILPENPSITVDDLLSEKNEEIAKLREENAILRESLKAMINQNKCQRTKSYDEDIRQLNELTSLLRASLLKQQKEIESLKEQSKNDRSILKNLMCNRKILDEKTAMLSHLTLIPIPGVDILDHLPSLCLD